MKSDQAKRFAIVVVAVLIGCALVWYVVDRSYITPRQEKLTAIESEQASIDKYRDALNRGPSIQRSLRGYESRTLGGDLETVDHELRARLNHIGQASSVTGVRVDTGRYVSLQSPAKRLFSGRLSDEFDFVEVEGSISAEGTLKEVAELIDRIDAEPWPKQIDQVSLDPKGNGKTFKVVVRLTTLFIPGRSPTTQPTSDWKTNRLARVASLFKNNPFHLPPPAKPAKAVAAASVSQRPSFPYHKWALTGVIESPVTEAHVREADSGQARVLKVGDRVHEMELVAVNGFVAHFVFEGKAWSVELGSTMNDRQQISETEKIGSAQ